jgi:valyl-tRNA synthetase
VTKLWNVARFSERFLTGYQPPAELPPSTPADRWILSSLQRLVDDVTALYEGYEYAAAKAEVETFFWRDLADNYLEIAKQRLYDEADPLRDGARYALYHALRTVVHLLAPILPYITEEIYAGLFAGDEEAGSVHRSPWPVSDSALRDEDAEAVGALLIDIATAVRRYKSTHNLSLSTELARLQLAPDRSALATDLQAAVPDLLSVTRAARVEIRESLDPDLELLNTEGPYRAGLAP